MTRTSALAAIVCVGLSTAITSQQRPDFSGSWTLVTPPAAPASAGTAPAPRGDMGSGWGPRFRITQDATELVVEQPFFSRYDLMPPLKYVFSLSGSETRNAVMMGHAAQVRVSHATWEAQTLVITTEYPFSDPASGRSLTTEARQRLSLESPTRLVIDVTREGMLGGQATTARAIYSKEM